MWPGIELRSPGPLANTLLTRPMSRYFHFILLEEKYPLKLTNVDSSKEIYNLFPLLWIYFH